MKKSLFKITTFIIICLIGLIIITFSNKPIGGINKLFTTYSFSEKMELIEEQPLDSNIPDRINVRISGYSLLWSNKFHGQITIDNMTIDDNNDEYSLLVLENQNKYTIFLIEKPLVAENGIDLIPSEKYVTILLSEGAVKVIINNNTYTICENVEKWSNYHG